jgi:hypothetical protein
MVTADAAGLGEKSTFDVSQELAKWDGTGETQSATKQIVPSNLILFIGIGSAIVVLLSVSLFVLVFRKTRIK